MPADGPPRSTPSWFLDELGRAGRENLDPDHVARYDDKEDASAPACAKVIAIDISPLMLRRLEEKVHCVGWKTSSSSEPGS